MSQQGYRQASIRGVTASAEPLEGDWHRLFAVASIAASFTDSKGVVVPIPFNERLLLWINLKLSKSYTSLPEAQQAYAVAKGAYNWSSLGTFTP